MRLGPTLKALPVAGPVLLAIVALAAGPGAPTVRADAAAADLANLHEDLSGANQRLAELTLRVEQLEHDNAELKARLGSQDRGGVSEAQLDAAVATLNASTRAAIASARTEILQRVATQLEKLARQTNAALDAIDKGQAGRAARPAPDPGAAEAGASPAAQASPPAARGTGDGAAAPVSPAAPAAAGARSYTIQKGDTLGAIARRTHASVRAIMAANAITDPSMIQAGQVLAIPGGP